MKTRETLLKSIIIPCLFYNFIIGQLSSKRIDSLIIDINKIMHTYDLKNICFTDGSEGILCYLADTLKYLKVKDISEPWNSEEDIYFYNNNVLYLESEIEKTILGSINEKECEFDNE